jgi:hypothetical protein
MDSLYKMHVSDLLNEMRRNATLAGIYKERARLAESDASYRAWDGRARESNRKVDVTRARLNRILDLSNSDIEDNANSSDNSTEKV